MHPARGIDPQPHEINRVPTGTGYHLRLDNGWTVSVQWSVGAYASPNTAEVARWYADKDTEDARGWQTVDEIIAYIADTARFDGEPTLDPDTIELKNLKVGIERAASSGYVATIRAEGFTAALASGIGATQTQALLAAAKQLAGER